MKISIIPSDKVVVVDGIAREVNTSGAPADFHALQFDSAAKFGTIEGKDGSITSIDALGSYNVWLVRWNDAAPPPDKITPEEMEKAQIIIMAQSNLRRIAEATSYWLRKLAIGTEAEKAKARSELLLLEHNSDVEKSKLPGGYP